MFEIVPVERKPTGPATRLGRRALGWTLTVLGVCTIVLFLRALIAEVMGGTMFGGGICLLVLAFGALLTRDGIALAMDRRIQLRPVD